MLALLIWFVFVVVLYVTLRPRIGQVWATLLALALVSMASVAFSTERLSVSAVAIQARSNPIGLAIMAGMLASMALTLYALLNRSWPAMWLAALGSLPLVISSIGFYTLAVTCLQLAAAIALWRHVSTPGWALAVLGGLLFWGYLLPLSHLLSLFVPGNIALSLLTVAFLLPLLPIGVGHSRPSPVAARAP